jgi:tetraacyldisaccharide 4'-kinase
VHDASCPVLRAAIEPQSGERFDRVRIVAFAGIGRPEKFFATLRRLGAVLVIAEPFADHHRYREAEIAGLRNRAAREDARLMTTAKDWVRLPPSWRAGIEVLEVEIRWQDPAGLNRLLSDFYDRRDRHAAGD